MGVGRVHGHLDHADYAGRPKPPGVHEQGLAATSVACMEACDPYCQQLADTPGDLMSAPISAPMPPGLPFTPTASRAGTVRTSA